MTSEMNMENKAGIQFAKHYARAALSDMNEAVKIGEMTKDRRDVILMSLGLAVSYIEEIKPTDEEQG